MRVVLLMLCSIVFFLPSPAQGQSQWGQDTQFSQFYAAPLFHNPAFAGGAFAPRIGVNYRNQWPSLNANFVTNLVSFDMPIQKLNGGVGVLLVNDVNSTNRFLNTELAGQYAQQIQLSDEHFLRLGVQAGVSARRVNTTGLIFGDQIQQNGTGGYDISPNSADILANGQYRPAFIADFSSGILYYNPKAWLGLAVHHLSNPTITHVPRDVTMVGKQLQGKLPLKYSLQGGMNIPLANPYGLARGLDNPFTLSPAFLLKRQGPFTQLDLGTYATYSPLTLGVWYRGIPIGRQGMNNDAVVGLLGFRFDKFSIGYSYDLTISKLGTASGGSHELSFTYQFEAEDGPKTPSARRRRKELSCPKF